MGAISWSYRQLAEHAAKTTDRAGFLRDVHAAYRPAQTELPPRLERALDIAIDDALERTTIGSVHATPHRWTVPMLRDGFGWPRPRHAGGYEPYEQKLAALGALAAGERSEDILFTGLRFFQVDGTFDELATTHVLAARFGQSQLLFAPQTLIDATLTPAVSLTRMPALRPGTIEDLPSMLKVRLATEHGYNAASYASFLKRLSLHRKADVRYAEAVALRPTFDAAMAGTREDRARFVTGQIAPHDLGDLVDQPLETHSRRLRPRDVVGVHASAPDVDLVDEAEWSTKAAKLRELRADPNRLRGVTGLLERERIAELRDAAESVGAATMGLESHEFVNELLDATTKRVIVRRPGATASVSYGIRPGEINVIYDGAFEDAATSIDTVALQQVIARRLANPIPDSGGPDVGLGSGTAFWF